MIPGRLAERVRLIFAKTCSPLPVSPMQPPPPSILTVQGLYWQEGFRFRDATLDAQEGDPHDHTQGRRPLCSHPRHADRRQRPQLSTSRNSLPTPPPSIVNEAAVAALGVKDPLHLILYNHAICSRPSPIMSSES